MKKFVLSLISFFAFVIPLFGAETVGEKTEQWVELIRSGSAEQIAEAIAEGADLTLIHPLTGSSLLHIAATSNSSPEVIDLLVRSGLVINAKNFQGGTPLFSAVGARCRPEIIAALINKGAEVDEPNNAGWTPLYLAISGNRGYDERPLAIIETLLAAGADINATADISDTNGVAGVSLLHTAAMYNQNPAMIDLLIARGAKIEAKTADGLTPLHYAALLNFAPEITESLLKNGANPNAKNKNGDTPLDAAVSAQNWEAAKLIGTAGGKLGY